MFRSQQIIISLSFSELKKCTVKR